MIRRAALALGLLVLGSSAACGLERIGPGARLRDFTLPRLDGEPLRLADSLGATATVVVFWSTWSPRSAEVLSDLQIFYKKHGRGKLQVVAVNVEHEKWDPAEAPRIREYLAGEGVTFPVLVDTDLAVYESHGFTSVPSSVLADASGTVVWVLPGYPEHERVEFLEKILDVLGLATSRPAEAPPAPAPAAGVYVPQGKAGSFFSTGRALLKKGRREDALVAFRKAMQEDPAYLPVYVALAEALEGAGRPEEAAEMRRRAAALASGTTEPPSP